MKRREFLKQGTAAGVTFLASPGIDFGGACGLTERQPDTAIRHDYDPLSDQVTSRILDGLHPRLGQSFTVPDGATEISGFRLKIRRLGDSPDLRYRIGSHYGADDIAAGKIRAEAINPFFEFFYGGDFAPKPCRSGKKYFIQLSCNELSPPSGSYELYGTTTEGENPVNLDYGARTPEYFGGEAHDQTGNSIPGVNFAFEVFFGPGDSGRNVGKEEPSFEFVNELLRGPHTHSVRNAMAKPAAGALVIDSSWRIIAAQGHNEIEATALADFHKYLTVGMEVRPTLEVVARLNAEAYRKAFVVATKEQMPQFGENLETSESYRVEVTDERVTICGYDARGVMRALVYLEDLMNFKRAPFLDKMDALRSPRFTPRITCLPFYSGLELDSPIDPYTDQALLLITHYGFNAIWVWGKLHDLGQSDIFPELGQQADTKIQRLNGIINRAEKYGIDVYLYLSKDPLPDPFFNKHPEVRGSQRDLSDRYSGMGNLMCTSVPKVQKYIEEATRSIFIHAAGLKGIIFIVGGEGFNHDWTRGDAADCPRCRNRSPVEVVTKIVESLDRGAKSAKPDADVVVWTYGASGTWSQGDDAQARLIERLPRDVILLSNFSKGGHVEIDGVRERVYDYSISYLGPSEKFRSQVRLCRERGVRVWAKTECMISLEFIQTPYIPVYQRWIERYEKLRGFPEVAGLFMNWDHYGFMPSRVLELAKWFTFNPVPQGQEWLVGIAARDFGSEASPDALRAWEHFSRAIAEYPFSPSVAVGPIQSGPALPLFFNADYQPQHRSGRQFTNDLLWTRPWGPRACAESLSCLEKEWADGVALLHQVRIKTPPGRNSDVGRELGVAQALLSCVRSVLNQIEFCELRYQLQVAESQEKAKGVLDRLEAVAQREIQNSTEALKWVRVDSRLGYANGGAGITIGGSRAGIYTPKMIEKKITTLQRMLDTGIPRYRGQLS